ncbi:UNVERIFIED_CONTAM: hypothetical protein K2H54_040960 [Gekko kuhli]
MKAGCGENPSLANWQPYGSGELRQERVFFTLLSSPSYNTGFTFLLTLSCSNNKTSLEEGNGSGPGEIYFPCDPCHFRGSGKLPFDTLMTSNYLNSECHTYIMEDKSGKVMHRGSSSLRLLQ